ncbi:hypothetical protein SUGI_0547450 [Cryptomeria japonica]|nr:hypothetical protein SUGI_0547450 [Cryptomeria japonica]
MDCSPLEVERLLLCWVVRGVSGLMVFSAPYSIKVALSSIEVETRHEGVVRLLLATGGLFSLSVCFLPRPI